jgi:hypothetical protein
MNWVLD